MIFTWNDLARTRRREDNRVQACVRWGRRVLVPEIMKNGDALIDDILDPACPNWTLSSGYRSPALNSAVGGSPNSAHLIGLAADLEPPGPFADSIMFLARLDGLPIERLIYEVRGKSRWLHVQRRALTAKPIPTIWLHSPAPAQYLQMSLDALAHTASLDEPRSSTP